MVIKLILTKKRHLNFIKWLQEEGMLMHKAKKSCIFIRTGEGTEKNIESAISWYKKAVENGCQKAKQDLNNLLLNK